MPLLVAIASILNTFSLVWLMTYIADVSIIVQFLIALVGLGIAIDYSLLVIFRFREELRHGHDTESALVTTMQHAGRSVIVSGSTVAVGLLSMILLPLPFIRSIGIGGMLIPAVSVLAAITFLPAMLATIGPKINSVARDAEAHRRRLGRARPASGTAGRRSSSAARFPSRSPGSRSSASLLFYGLQLNPSEAQAKDFPGAGDAINGRAALAAAGVSPGVYKPFEILVEGANPGRTAAAPREHARATTPGIVGRVGAEGVAHRRTSRSSRRSRRTTAPRRTCAA